MPTVILDHSWHDAGSGAGVQRWHKRRKAGSPDWMFDQAPLVAPCDAEGSLASPNHLINARL
jgi:hypothetical protein